MAYEVTKDYPLKEKEIETPICKTTIKQLGGKKLAIVPILRAGLGMVDGMLHLFHQQRLDILVFTGIQ